MVRRALPAIVAGSAVTAIGTGIWLGYRFVTTSERFAVASIEVHGASHLAPDDIRAALPLKVGENIFTADLGSLTNTLRAHPWIASATAHRVLPYTVVVEVREHVAVAIVQLGELYLVDDAGQPFKKTQLDAGDGDGLPVVTGFDRAAYQRDPRTTSAAILAALDALAEWRREPSRPTIGELHVDAQHALTLRTYDHGSAIQLGPVAAGAAALADRMRTFDAVWAELTDAERARVRTLHLDNRPDHVTVAFVKD